MEFCNLFENRPDDVSCEYHDSSEFYLIYHRLLEAACYRCAERPRAYRWVCATDNTSTLCRKDRVDSRSLV